MGGKSKSSSSSSSSNTTNTNTSNLNLDGVEGVTVVGSDGATLNITDGGAFEVVNRTIQAGEALFASALSSISETNNRSLEQLTKNTVASLDKVNQSNQSEQEALAGKFQMTVIAALLTYGAVKVWGKK